MDSLAIADAVLKQQQHYDYAGYDPFDGLNSRLFRALQLHRSSLLRLIWLQGNKILPINLRPLLFVPRMRNPKGIALFILGLLEDYQRTNAEETLSEARRLADWLLINTSDRVTWQHACWGYHFDWQARAFYVPQGKPNIITTSYIASALHQLYALTNEKKYLDAAVDAAYFICKHLSAKDGRGRSYFAYIPGEEAFVHNASLWGAATVARAAAVNGDHNLVEKALDVATLSTEQQREDGAWVYGARHHHQFIDGFHTGYNLEALNALAEVLDTKQFDSNIRRGLDYYRENFFLDDGAPKYYNNQKYPIDMHSSAQAILTFGKIDSRFGLEQDKQLMAKILNWAITHMYMEKKKAFRYQINRHYNNNVVYARWTQAWAYYALAFYNHFLQEQNDIQDVDSIS